MQARSVLKSVGEYISRKLQETTKILEEKAEREKNKMEIEKPGVYKSGMGRVIATAQAPGQSSHVHVHTVKVLIFAVSNLNTSNANSRRC